MDSLNPFEEKRDYFATSVLSEGKNFNLIQRRFLWLKIYKSLKLKTMFYLLVWEKPFKSGAKNFEKFKSFARKKAFQNRSNLK